MNVFKRKVLFFVFILCSAYLLLWVTLSYFYNYEVLLFSLPDELEKYYPKSSVFVHFFIKASTASSALFVFIIPLILYKKFSNYSVIAYSLILLSFIFIINNKFSSKNTLEYWFYPFEYNTWFVSNNCVENYPLDNMDLRYKNHKSYLEFVVFLNKELKLKKNEFEKTSLIRKRVAELIDLGEDNTCLSNTRIPWGVFDAKKFYDIFYKDSYSVYCGGASLFLNKVYEDFGYASYRYDMGSSTATHQTNIVYLSDVNKWVLQDAYFNLTFVDSMTNQPVDFFDFLTAVKSNNDKNVIFFQDVYSYKTDFLSNNECEVIKSKNWSIKRENKIYRGLHSGNLKLKSNRYLTDYLSDDFIAERLLNVFQTEFNLSVLNERTFKKLFLLNKSSSNDKWLNEKIDKTLDNE